MKAGNEQGTGDSSEKDHSVSAERKEVALVA
jgi:hypothetical protein